jgi:hypothetical protein
MLALLLAVALEPGIGQARTPGAMGAVSSRVVVRWPIQSDSAPQWARFSPIDPDWVLVDTGNGGLLLQASHGVVRRLPEELLPVGWLGGSIVVRGEAGAFRLLAPAELKPSTRLLPGSVPLPATWGKNRRLLFEMALPPTATTGIGASHAEKTSASLLTTRQIQAGFGVGPDPSGQIVVDPSGKTVFRGAKRIQGVTPSPDNFKMIVYYGNTEYVLFNRLTRTTVPLPSLVHAWHWMPDNSTLLGEVSVGRDPCCEEVIRTDLYLHQTTGGGLKRVRLPQQLQDAALDILDISLEGRILVAAERVVHAPEYLGMAVLEIVWP